MAGQFKYINSAHVGDNGTVVVKYKKSDNSVVEIPGVVPNVTVFPSTPETDGRALRWLRADTRNFLEV